MTKICFSNISKEIQCHYFDEEVFTINLLTSHKYCVISSVILNVSFLWEEFFRIILSTVDKF